jgi:hypothetical protein
MRILRRYSSANRSKHKYDRPKRDAWDTIFGLGGVLTGIAATISAFGAFAVARIAANQARQVAEIERKKAVEVQVLADQAGQYLSRMNGQYNWHQLRANIQATDHLSARQDKTQRDIATLENRQKAFSSDTERQKFLAETDLKRDEQFSALIKDITDPDRSSVALLALWQLCDSGKNPEEGRRMVVAAALAVDNPQMVYDLHLLQENKVEHFIHVLSSSKDPRIQSAIARYQRASYPAAALDDQVNAFLKSTQHHVVLLREDPLLRAIIEVAASRERKFRDELKRLAAKAKESEPEPYLAYALFKSASKSEVRADTLNELVDMFAHSEGRGYNVAKSRVFREGDFSKQEWQSIVGALLQIKPRPSEDVLLLLASSNVVREFADSMSDSAMRQSVVQCAYDQFVAKGNTVKSGLARTNALACLVAWSPETAVTAVSELLASSSEDHTPIVAVIEGFMEQGAEDAEVPPKKLAVALAQNKTPKIRDSTERWIDWRKNNQVFLMQYGRPSGKPMGPGDTTQNNSLWRAD